MSHLELFTPNKQLIRESFDDFILSREAMLRTPKTLIFYRYTVGGFVEWLILQGITEPQQIKSHHIRVFLAETARRGDTRGSFASGSCASGGAAAV